MPTIFVPSLLMEVGRWLSCSDGTPGARLIDDMLGLATFIVVVGYFYCWEGDIKYCHGVTKNQRHRSVCFSLIDDMLRLATFIVVVDISPAGREISTVAMVSQEPTS